MKKKLNIGVIGAGGMAGVHLSAYASYSNKVNLVAVADKFKDALEAKVRKYNIRGYSNHKDMFRKEKLDGVSICTPPNSHKEIAIDALKRGINVFCEKPLALTAKDAKTIVNLAKKKRRVIMTAFCHRFHEPIMALKKLIVKGKLGKIVTFRNRFAGDMNMEKKWFSKKKIAGGGTLLDTSVHSIDLFNYLIGDVKNVSARCKTMVQKMDVEDTNVILLEAKNKTLGIIEASWSTPFSPNCVEIYGSKGMGVADYAKDECRYRTIKDKRWKIIPSTGKSRFKLEIGHFINVILKKERPILLPGDGIKTAQIVDAAYESIRRHAWVDIKQ